LQTIYDSFRHYWTGLNSAATVLVEFDVFVHKLRGLSTMLAAGKENDVRQRLVLNDMSKSIYRGYAIDAEREELDYVTRNLSGIGDVLEKLRIDIIGASQIPHTILFGESPSGLGATGRSEERDFAKFLGDYQAAHYKRPLQKLMEMIMLSKSGPTKGELPESWRVSFNDLFELNEREKADVRARVAAVDGRMLQLGVLHPQEVREARYGGSEWSMETALDPSLKANDAMLAPKVGGAVPPGGRDPLNQENGTLPMDGSREVQDAAGLFLEGDLEHERGDVEFTDKELHQQAIAAAKSKFKTWPSAVAGAYVTRKYKELYKRKHGSMEKAFKGKKTTAEYFKEDAEAIKASGLVLGGVDEAALISEEDIAEALQQWKAEAPAQFKELLEADNAE
jgi:hypothetical protein